MRTQLARKAVVHSRNRLSACHRVPNQSVDLLDRLNLCPYNNTHLPNLTRPACRLCSVFNIHNTVVLGRCRRTTAASASKPAPVNKAVAGSGTAVSVATISRLKDRLAPSGGPPLLGSSVAFRSVMKNVNRAVSPGAKLTFSKRKRSRTWYPGLQAASSLRDDGAWSGRHSEQCYVLRTVSRLRQISIAEYPETDTVGL